MDDRFEQARQALEHAVLAGPGHTPPELRQRVAARRDAPAELRPLLEKIEGEAYRVTDADLSALQAAYSDDQRFEIVVAAALGSALLRLQAGLRALEEA